jgi:hypothetical protein
MQSWRWALKACEFAFAEMARAKPVVSTDDPLRILVRAHLSSEQVTCAFIESETGHGNQWFADSFEMAIRT